MAIHKGASRKNQLFARRRELNQRGSNSSSLLAGHKSEYKLSIELEKVSELLDNNRLIEAERILDRLQASNPNNGNVLFAQIGCYQLLKEPRKAIVAIEKARQFVEPTLPLEMAYAQELIRSDRSSAAYQQILKCLDQFDVQASAPEYEQLQKFLTSIKPILEKRLQSIGFSMDQLDCLDLHERSLECLAHQDFESCISNCQELLRKTPAFTSPRNNIAVAQFHLSKIAQATETIRETLRQFPDSQFAQCFNARLHFFAGEFTECNQLLDTLLTRSFSLPDTINCLAETLLHAGRFAEAKEYCLAITESRAVSESVFPRLLHFAAYASARLEDIEGAESLWLRCKELGGPFSWAEENLKLLKLRRYEELSGLEAYNWFPGKVYQILQQKKIGWEKDSLKLWPEMRLLFPVMLRNADAVVALLAVQLAHADRSKSSLNALQSFATGSEGAAIVREKAMTALKEWGQKSN